MPLAYLGWWTQAEGSATKKQRSSTPPGEEIPEKINKDLWEVLSPWNPALLKATDRGIDRMFEECFRLSGGARASFEKGR